MQRIIPRLAIAFLTFAIGVTLNFAYLSSIAKIVENEKEVLRLLQSGFMVGQINCFYNEQHYKERYCAYEELVAAGWVSETDKEYKGYRITFIVSTNKKHYEVIAVPIKYGETGVYSFYLDETGGGHAADRQGHPASANDPSIFDYNRWRNR